MKKSIIAAGAASVALAAMPIVGAFALTSVTDTINATVGAGCTISDSTDHNVTISVTPGSTATSTAAESITVVCNSNAWNVTAVGATVGDDNTALYSGENAIATGTATSGTTSNWAFKIDSATNAAISTGYNAWAEIPDTATNVVDGSAAATSVVTTQSQVYAASGQASGTYTGKVTYTVTPLAS